MFWRPWHLTHAPQILTVLHRRLHQEQGVLHLVLIGRYGLNWWLEERNVEQVLSWLEVTFLRGKILARSAGLRHGSCVTT